jgi:hypothetical protein
MLSSSCRVAVLLVGAISGLSAARGDACSCTGPFPAKWLKDGGLVFRGKVIRLQAGEVAVVVDGKRTSRRVLQAVFAPLERFKGPGTAEYVVSDHECEERGDHSWECFGAFCSADFSVGEEYLVSTSESSLDGDQSADRCSAFDLADSKAGKSALAELRKLAKTGRSRTSG